MCILTKLYALTIVSECVLFLDSLTSTYSFNPQQTSSSFTANNRITLRAPHDSFIVLWGKKMNSNLWNHSCFFTTMSGFLT